MESWRKKSCMLMPNNSKYPTHKPPLPLFFFVTYFVFNCGYEVTRKLLSLLRFSIILAVRHCFAHFLLKDISDTVLITTLKSRCQMPVKF